MRVWVRAVWMRCIHCAERSQQFSVFLLMPLPVAGAGRPRPPRQRQERGHRFSSGAERKHPEWRRLVGDLIGRGLIDGLVSMAAPDCSPPPTAYPGVPVHRCCACKIRNVRAEAGCRPAGRQGRYARHHQPHYRAAGTLGSPPLRRPIIPSPPCATISLNCLPLGAKTPGPGKAARTTNAIERRFREVRLRTRPIGVFSDSTAMDGILFAVFNYKNQHQGVSTPLPADTNLLTSPLEGRNATI